MASTFSAPEPIYIAAASTNPQCIYLLESAGVRPDEAFVARIDPDRTHALFGSTEDLRLQSFLKMIPEPGDCSQGLHQLRSAVLQHLTKYAVVSKRLEKMRVLQSFIE